MRNYALDRIRCITVLLVVVYHVIFLFNGVVSLGVIGPFAPTQPQDALMYVLYPWFMVILFLVSGASARYALQKQTPKAFFRARTRKLLVPSTLGILALGWAQGYFNMRFSGAFESMPEGIPAPVMYLILSVSGTGVLWYIQLLWLFTALLLPVRKLERDRLAPLCEKANGLVLLALGVLVWLSAQVLNTPLIAVYRFGIYGCCFFIGYFILAHTRVQQRLARWSVPLALAAVVLAVVYVRVYFGQDCATEPVVNSPLSILYGWIACLAIFACAARWGNAPARWLTFLRRESFGIYIFHYLVISVVGSALVTYTTLPAWAIYLLTLAAAVPGSIALNAVISRVPVLRYLVLGIRREGR